MDSHSSSSHKASSEHHKHQANPAQLLSSAKVVAEAAKSTLSHETGKIDKGKVAGAAGDLLGAASHYAKLEESSLGKYVTQAEGYLHQYHSSHSPVHHSAAAAAGVGHAASAATAAAAGEAHAPAAHGSGEDHSGGGYGDYLKMAGGFLKNSSSHSNGEGQSEGGFGDYLKLAEGFLKKR